MTTKTLDSKGRVTLGMPYAGQTVDIDDSDPNCIVIKPVVMIPAQEAWLYRNERALYLVREGLSEASHGVFSSSPPDVEEDMEWLDDIDE